MVRQSLFRSFTVFNMLDNYASVSSNVIWGKLSFFICCYQDSMRLSTKQFRSTWPTKIIINSFYLLSYPLWILYSLGNSRLTHSWIPHFPETSKFMPLNSNMGFVRSCVCAVVNEPRAFAHWTHALSQNHSSRWAFL